MPRGGIIAAGHKETARAGKLILEAGGNAFDAALAAVLASFVAEPSLTSMGGGGFMLTYTTDGKANLFDFFVQTPHRKTPVNEQDLHLSHINFGTTVQEQYIGRGTVAVPGCPAGIEEIHRQLGSLPLRIIAQPAIDLCKKGVRVSAYQAYSMSILGAILLHSEEIRKIFEKDGRLVREGDVMFRPLLADAIECLWRLGAKEFYEGEIGQRFARDNSENGGCVFYEDLKNYRVITRTPLARSYRGKMVLTNPLPSTGGNMIAHALAHLEQRNQMPSASGPEYVKHLVEIMQKMNSFRVDHLQNMIGNTTHISVIDRSGNAASVTTTLGGSSGQTIPGTGILSNNMLGETDLNPGGLNSWTPNSRLTSMMAPTIVLDHETPCIALGSGGSSRIRTAILQVLIHLIDYQRPVSDAVQYPRCHWEDNSLSVEPGILDKDESIDLPQTEIKIWGESSMYFGGVHAVIRDTHGNYSGSADKRRDGYVL